MLRTKLRPPVRRGGLVPRPELVTPMCGTHRRLATIQAAAGFGKTTLLAQCYEQARAVRPAAWLSLDAADNDYPRFLAHLLAALEGSGAVPGRELRQVARFGSSLAPGTCADLLTTALDGAGPLTVCVDDFHLLDDGVGVQLLAQLLLAPRSSLCWLLASRTAPAALPLHRLRLLDELLELDARALKFSDAQTHEFLCGAVGRPLEPAVTRALAERTEGWVAGLQLASLGLRAAADPAGVISGFSGAYRSVADFLRDAVLAQLDEPTREFLLLTSVLPRLTVELCNCVTGRGDARERLDQLEAMNLFIFSLDEERRWYRYHHLFAEFLEQRLRDRNPARACAAQVCASQWFEESGCTLEAIELALRAQAWERAARLLDELGLFDRGQAGTLERLAAKIPKGVLEQFPNLQLERIYGWEADWDFDRSRAGLNRLKGVLQAWRSGRQPVPGHVNLDYIAAKIAHREMMVLFVSDDLPGTRAACERWLAAGYCADVHMQVSTAGALLAARSAQYDCVGLPAAAAALHEQYRRAQWSFGEIFQCCISGLAFFRAGDVARAREMYECGLESACALHGRLSPLASMPALLLAELHYEQDRPAQARDLIGDYLGISHGLGYVDKLIAAYVTRARLEADDGRPAAAQQTLDEGEKCARMTGFARLQAHVLRERMRQLLECGQAAAVVDVARQAGLLGSCADLQPRAGATSLTECRAVGWAYAARAGGDVDGAIRLLKNWYRFTLDRQCHRPALGLAVELAVLFRIREDASAARQYLCEALRLAAPGGLIRPFTGAAVRQLLVEVLGQRPLPGAAAEHARAVLGVGHEPAWMPAPAAAAGVRGDEFSHREVDILELAAGDVPNREIARRLVLSEHTVKWYWKQIFGKLNVHRRLQAVISARAAGLIQ
ncbi:MAG TPA: LuxR C-terminal-related transcriptional regulator [Steroidobacteraceae bacterium]|nr:LuxR C-terminal-related transcriptional regulator [Steroidobacteraceae bacterium]